MVLVQYRLGILGFGALPDDPRALPAESGILGLLDQTLALQWGRVSPSFRPTDPFTLTLQIIFSFILLLQQLAYITIIFASHCQLKEQI